MGWGKRAKAVGCCERFKRKKGKGCKSCPLMATLSKAERKALRQRYR